LWRARLVVSTAEAQDQLGAQSPLGYVAQPEVIADAITCLASDQASYVSGVVLNVDGGRTAI
jgi:NAD(P)-dependent dehydrogenase (short-subunit alcohol dehydrogenase family)